MTRKFKTYAVIMLSVMLIFASCFGNWSFALTSDTGKNIEEGEYYIVNKETSLYLSGFDFYSVLQNQFANVSNIDMQKWELRYVSNGYYEIINVSSGYYLTASDSAISGDDVLERPKTTNFSEKQLWKFDILESGQFAENDHCKITAKSHIGTSLALVGDSYLSDYGYTVIQDTYILDYNFYDEWILIPVDNAFLIHIPYPSMNQGLQNVNNILDMAGINSEFLTCYVSPDDNIDEDAFKKNHLIAKMETSNIFVMLAHGDRGEPGKTMVLDPFGNVILESEDIYDFNSNTGLDLSDSELMIFLGCETANHPTQSLPQAAILAGSDYAIGFENTINVGEANLWVERFFEAYVLGEDIEDSAYDIAFEMLESDEVDSKGIDSIYVFCE